MQTLGIAEISQRLRNADFSVFMPFSEFLGVAEGDVSVVGTDKTASHSGRYVTALLHASKSYTECRSHGHHFLHLGADAPNLLISHDTKGQLSTVPDDLRFAGTTSNVVIEIKEELLGVIEAVDLLDRLAKAHHHRLLGFGHLHHAGEQSHQQHSR